MGFSFCIVCPSVLSLSDFKLHKTQAAKNIFVEGKLLSQLTFNPGLVLTGFQTTRPKFCFVCIKGNVTICYASVGSSLAIAQFLISGQLRITV